MLIHGNILKQIANASSDKKENNTEITLVFEESEIFYLALDQEVKRTRPVKVIFNYEKAQEGSKMLEKIASCSNGKDALLRLGEFVLKIPELKKAYIEKDIQRLLELYDSIGKESMYAIYEASFEYDEKIGGYTASFIPNKKHKTDIKSTLFMM